ncbi:MAG TPA: DUF4126 family protein [Acidobacteriaceae bacterium]
MPALLFCLLLGVFNGCRTIIPTAILCWFAWTGHLHAEGMWFAFLAHPVAVAIFTMCAASELVADKLPGTPSRLQAPLLFARLCAGAFAGAVLASAIFAGIRNGAMLGTSGALLGAILGYWLRTQTVIRLRLPDYTVALTEDLIVIVGSIAVVAPSRA